MEEFLITFCSAKVLFTHHYFFCINYPFMLRMTLNSFILRARSAYEIVRIIILFKQGLCAYKESSLRL